MKLLFLLPLFLFFSAAVSAQVNKTYHVLVNQLNLRSEPNAKAEVLTKLKKYDNLTLIAEEDENGWVKVQHGSRTGYVMANNIKRGKALVGTYQVRNGAICKDGSRSTATGRGACSHHGGVREWLHYEKETVDIIMD